MNYVVRPDDGDKIAKFILYGFFSSIAFLLLTCLALWLSDDECQEQCVRYKYGVVTRVYETGSGRSHKENHVEVEFGNERLDYTDSKKSYRVGDEYCRCTEWQQVKKK